MLDIDEPEDDPRVDKEEGGRPTGIPDRLTACEAGTGSFEACLALAVLLGFVISFAVEGLGASPATGTLLLLMADASLADGPAEERDAVLLTDATPSGALKFAIPTPFATGSSSLTWPSTTPLLGFSGDSGRGTCRANSSKCTVLD